MTKGPKGKEKDKKPKVSDGTSVGIVWFCLFLIGFFILGYNVLLSIFLAILGGFALRIIVDWWKSKDEPIAEKKVEPVDEPIDPQRLPFPDRLRPDSLEGQQGWAKYTAPPPTKILPKKR